MTRSLIHITLVGEIIPISHGRITINFKISNQSLPLRLKILVKMLARNTVQFQQTTNSTLQQHSAALTKMETQLGPTQEENEKSNDDPSNATFSNMPAYGKFFKELNTYKRKYGPNEKVMVSENVMLDMEEAPIHDRELPILLGRPFMATAKTIIDVQNGLLTMTVLGETVQFKVFESLSHPSSSFDCCSIDVLDSIVFSKFLLAQSNDPLQYVLSQSRNDFDEEVLIEIVAALEALKPYPSTFSPLIEPLGPSTHLIPSVVKPPELELKPLPSH
ncbi:unnamed protein product, partial [Prunus brigantina]